MKTFAVILGLAGGFAVALPLAQQDGRYRSATDLVSIYVTVTDKTRRLVPDLTKDDFEVFDNGRRQALSLFSNEIQPITCVLMLDRSGSMAGNEDLERDGASEFVKQLIPADRIRIGSFANHIRISPAGFTSDKQVLLGILKTGLEPIGPSPVWTAIDRSITALLNETGRRVVLAFTDGRDDPERGQVKTDLKDLKHRAKFDDIMIYAIGFGSGGPSRLKFDLGRSRQAAFPPTKYQPPDPALKELAEESGGGYFEMDETHDLGATFTRVAEELHRQYWLGFAPTKLDGKTHKLEIKVRRPGVVVQSKKSYVAGK